jgi:Ser/Thr protein kinase RdoA (MazF antagonist)
MPAPIVTTTSHALTRLARVCNLGPIESVERLSTGYLNDNYRLTSSAGTYMLKHHRRARAGKVRHEHEVVRGLAIRGIPVVCPLHPAPGEAFLSSRRRPLVLFPWMDGEHRTGLQLTEAESAQLGAKLAELHGALAAMLPRVQQTFYHPPARPESTREKAERLLCLLEQRDDNDGFDAFAYRYLRDLATVLRDAAPQRPDALAVLPVGYLHGDFIPNNVLYRDREIACVLDWERVRVGARSLELVRATAFWFTDPDDGALDMPRARAFVEAYSERHPLHRGELEAMLARFWWEKLNDLWVFDRHYGCADDSADHIAVHTARWLSWWSERREHLFATLGASVLVC